MNWKKIFRALLALLYPPRCMFCGKRVSSELQACPDCEKEVFPDPVFFQLPMHRQVVYGMAPGTYQGGLRRALIQFKFYGRREYAPYFADKMAEAVQKSGFLDRVSVVTDVPLSRKRLLSRGYNQSALLAKSIAKKLGLPYEETLEKIRDNLPQHQLGVEDRRKNVRQVYHLRDRASVDGKRYLLVDDIVTTGETLSECTRTLFSGGAAGVVCLAAAKAGKKPHRISE